jgi:hypothetical protein
MKPLIFKAISGATYGALWALDQAMFISGWVLGFTFGTSKWVVANIGQFFMRVLTPDQLEEAVEQLNLETQQSELELLATASQLKEHAVELGEWTDSHTEALEAIGNALLIECSWEEQSIHEWMSRLVESIGLTYEAGDPDQ